MRLRAVESTSVAAIGYDQLLSRLFIEFRDSGEVYVYFDVPEHVFSELEAASSIGRYVNDKIKYRYRCERVMGFRLGRR